LRASVVDIQIEIENVRNDYGLSGASDNDIKPTTPTNHTTSVDDALIKKDNSIEQLARLKRNKKLQVERIENMLTILREDEIQLVEFRYFKKYSLYRIAGLLDLSYETVKGNRRLIISSLATFLNSKQNQ
ncbi:MAG: hypothetical protein RR744_10920, partial [Cellulosilyticaceae bacterium]